MIPTIQWQTQTGTPVTAAGYTIRPVSQALAFRWRGQADRQAFGVIWNRPTAVLVERDGEVEEHPITDDTRLAQLFLLLGAGFVLLVLRLVRKSRSSSAKS
jgi:hypothetical protein